MRSFRCLCGLLAFMLIIAVGSQEVEPAAPEAAPVAEPVDASVVDRGLREQSIYIPYNKLKEVFEQEGRGVFVPYEEFQRLWQAALQHEKQERRKVEGPGVMARELVVEARVKGEVVEAKAVMTVDLLRRGWHEIPLRLQGSAITTAMLGDQPARLAGNVSDGYTLLVEHRQDEPASLELSFTFISRYGRREGRNEALFHPPRAPVSQWRVSVAEAGVDIQIDPPIAVSSVPPAEGESESRILAFLGAPEQVRITWTPKAEGARGLEPLITVRGMHVLEIGEGVLRARHTLSYQVSRAPVTSFEIDVSPEHKVVNVLSENVREWSVKDGEEGMQRVIVALFEPVKESQEVVLETEFFVKGSQRLEAPLVRALGVVRQQGILVLAPDDRLSPEVVERQGLSRADIKAEEMREKPSGVWSAFRYSSMPYRLVFDVLPVLPRVAVTTTAQAWLLPDELKLTVRHRYRIERAGLFQAQALIPDGFEVRQVEVKATNEEQSLYLNSHHVSEGERRILTANLASEMREPFDLIIELYRVLEEEGLRSPAADPARIEVPLPGVPAETVERQDGTLQILTVESLRLTELENRGLRPISALASPGKLDPGWQLVLAYASAGEQAAVTLQAQVRRPQVTVGQLLITNVESGVVNYNLRLYYTIQYSGVRQLRIDVPEEIAERVRLTTAGLRESRIAVGEAEPAPAEGLVAIAIHGQREFLGVQMVELTWESRMDELQVGQNVEIVVPRLVPQEVNRAWGQIVLNKAESIDVTPAEGTRGLRPIDPRQDLMHNVTMANAAMALEFHDEWELVLQAVRYETRAVKATSIERGLVRMVLTRGGVISVQALYQIRSVHQRLIVRLPGEPSFDAQPLRVNGRPVPLESGDGGDYHVPLAGNNADQAFLLELRYLVDADRMLMIPSFPREPAVQRIYLSVFVPEDLTYLGGLGAWTHEMVWATRGFSALPRANRESESLLAWVAEGTPAEVEQLKSFAVDGRHLLYSSLRPAPELAGALRLLLLRDWIVKGLVLLIGIAIGLWLTPATLQRRAWVVGSLVIIYLAIVVLMPSLALAMVNNAVVAGAFMVLIIWIVYHVAVTVPRRRRPEEWAPTEVPPVASPSEEEVLPPEEPEIPPHEEEGEAGGDKDA